MKQASARMGIPIETLKKLKKGGADGFRGSRVYPAELESWIAANKEEFVETGISKSDTGDKADLMLRKLEAEAAHIETKVAILRRDYVPFADVKELLIELITKMRASLYQFQIREAPALLRGLEADQIRTIQKRRFDGLCEMMREIPDKLEDLGVAHLEESG